MNDISWLRSHVERCLQDHWGRYPLVVDGDGDYPFRWGTAACYVSVVDGDPRLVRVWGSAAKLPKGGLKLLAELNDINMRVPTAHVFWAGESVIAQQTVLAEGVSTQSLGQACDAVAGVADDIGPLLAAMFGGETPFSAVEDVADEAAEEDIC